MREQEMRLRVFQFLKARMRNMIMPAAVGIGLAAGGCLTKSEALYSAPLPSDAAMVKRDANRDANYNDMAVSSPEAFPADTREAAMASDMPLTGQDVATSVDLSVGDVFAPMDEKSDLRFPEAGMKYQGPVPPPDSGIDTGGEAGPVIAKYLAPMLDAANDLGLAVRYMAPITDGGAQS